MLAGDGFKPQSQMFVEIDIKANQILKKAFFKYITIGH